MLFTQYYLDCLSQASYLIGDTDTGRAIIVDPRRDISEYIADAEARGLTIEGVINTHFHADFLAGHLELSAKTGAWIGYGRRAEGVEYEYRALIEGERITLGNVALEIMETPGHTPESISVLVYEHRDDEVPYGVLTGDALFIGDVGRPDLLSSLGATAHELGAMLYDSIHNKLMRLPDAVRVFPAHGAGSSCGKNLSEERQSTIGIQRLTNYACQPMEQERFIDIVTDGQPSAPGYFVFDAVLNRKHHDLLDVASRMNPLSVQEVLQHRDSGAILLDGRDDQEFASGHLRGSINVPADGRFAERAGMVISPHSAIVVIAPQDREEEMIVRLGRVGFDNVMGYLREPEGAFLDAAAEMTHASRIRASELHELLERQPDIVLVDVRNVGELAEGVINDALQIPLSELPRRLDDVPRDRPVVVYCRSGVRSSIAASTLRHHGFADVTDLIGGFEAWQQAFTPAGV